MAWLVRNVEPCRHIWMAELSAYIGNQVFVNTGPFG